MNALQIGLDMLTRLEQRISRGLFEDLTIRE